MRTSYKVLISNLDGSFLNEGTRSFSAMVPARKEIREREIPLVTFHETRRIQTRLGIPDPFIVENVGAIEFRKGYFTAADSFCDKRGDSQRSSLELPYDQTILHWALLKQLVSGSIKGFSDLSNEEIAAKTSLSPEGSELSVTTGGKYFRLTGGRRAGQAVVLLRKLYQECDGPVPLGGIGKGATDLLMLGKVDCQRIVARVGGKHHQRPTQRLSQGRKMHSVGPGWTEAVSGMLDEWVQLHEG
jgi:predicted mannosyl-3-phosphoglycerate phosphatase (HAD superfamily)